MKVLIISANTFPFSPSGPAYVAGAALKAGHTVEVFDSLFSENPTQELEKHIVRFKPDVIGISIRTVAGKIADNNSEFNTKLYDARIFIKELVDCIKRISDVQIVLGGPGFNYFGKEWLKYLNCNYGIRGESEFSFPLYLKRVEEKGDIYSIPGCIYKKNNSFSKVPRELIENLDATALPAYELFDLDKYVKHNISAGIFTKRGCRFQCTFCPYSSLEGTRYRLKSPSRVVDEIEHIHQLNKAIKFQFCDNSFNVPQKHAEAICREIIDRNLDIKWATIDLKPIGITDELCRLFKDSCCIGLNLAIETASEKILKNIKRGYTVKQIHEALSCLVRSGIPFRISLMLGAPGETPETIAETFNVINSYSLDLGMFVTIGVNLWTHHQKFFDIVRRHGQFKNDDELFNEVSYISPDLPKDYMIDLINSLKNKKNCTICVHKPYAEYKW